MWSRAAALCSEQRSPALWGRCWGQNCLQHGRQQRGDQVGTVMTRRQRPRENAGDDLDWRGELGTASMALTPAMYCSYSHHHHDDASKDLL